jgi:hypothetical protein
MVRGFWNFMVPSPVTHGLSAIWLFHGKKYYVRMAVIFVSKS